MKIWVTATGRCIQGHVLDMALKPFAQLVKDYDSLLYVTWNPKKLKGWGCWEIRRRPEQKTVRDGDVVVFQGHTIVCPKYHELNLINHVMDVPFLNHSVLAKLKKMDTWAGSYKGKEFTNQIDYAEAKYDEKVETAAMKERDYAIKQHSSQIKWLKEFVLSGGNPYRLADHWK